MSVLTGTSKAINVFPGGTGRCGPLTQPPVGGGGVCVCSITDDFGRTVTNSWGRSTAGYDWFLDGVTADFSVSGGVATMTDASSGFSEADLRVFGQTQSIAVVMSVTGTVDGTNNGVSVQMNGSINGGFGSDTGETDIYRDGTVVLSSSGHSATGSIGSIVMTSPFNLKMVVNGSTLELYLWQGGSQPGTPTLSCSITADFWFAETLFLYTYSNDASMVTTWSALDLSGIDRCSYPQFDAFNRSEAGPSWGTASGGSNWTGVSGNAAVSNHQTAANRSASGGGLQPHVSGGSAAVVETAPVPWGDADLPFSCRWQWLTADAFHSSTSYQTTIAFGGGVSANTGVTIIMDNSGLSYELVSPDGVDGPHVLSSRKLTELLGEFHYDGANVDVRLWFSGETRPSSPQATLPMDGEPVSGDMLVSFSQVSGTSETDVTAWFHGITFFGYAGAPCYTICTDTGTTTVFDSFQRAINVSGAWGLPSSDPGFDWDDSASTAAFGTSGGFGYADLTSSTTLDEIWQDAGNDTLLWSHEFIAQIDFIHDGIDPNADVEFFLSTLENTTDEAVQAGVYLTTFTGDQSIIFLTGPSISANANITTNPGAGVVSHLKWHFIPGGVTEAKFWSEPDPEPSSYMATAPATATTSSGDKRLRIEADATYNVHVDFDNLVFETGSCTPVMPS